ncbi:MAG: hypothetical protein ACQESI_02470 [Pseudomonadota bacterium]
MYTYSITGIVHPERADVTIENVSALINESDQFNYSVYKSRIAGLLTTQAPIENYNNAAFIAQRCVRGITDALCFTNGCGYDVEIIQLLDNQSGHHRVFGVNEPAITSLNILQRISTEKVAELLQTSVAIDLERTFSDLREAIRKPSDSGFYCYRAIECLMNYYRHQHNYSKKQAWEHLRNTLNVTEETTTLIKAAADPIRHGNVREKSKLSRDDVLLKTWGIVESFINYALKNTAIKS